MTVKLVFSPDFQLKFENKTIHLNRILYISQTFREQNVIISKQVNKNKNSDNTFGAVHELRNTKKGGWRFVCLGVKPGYRG